MIRVYVLWIFSLFSVSVPLTYGWQDTLVLCQAHLPVLRLDKVGKGFGLLITVVVAVAVAVVLWADIVHLVDVTALGAPVHGAFTGKLDGQQALGSLTAGEQ